MSDDLLNSDVADQRHDDRRVERLTDGDSTAVAGDLQNAIRLDEVPETVAMRVFLQPLAVKEGRSRAQCSNR